MKDRLILFGKNLRAVIKNRGLKFNQAAEMLDISLTYMSQLMKGDSPPSFEMIINICQTFNVQPSELLDGKLTPEMDKLVAIASKLPDELVESLCTVAEALRGTAQKAAAGKL